MKRSGSIIFTFVGIALAAARASALEPAAQCRSGKLTEAAKYGLCRLKAEAKGVRTGASPDFSRCDAKYGLKWPKLEAKAGAGVCPSEGDATAIQAFVTQHATDVAAALAGDGLPTCNHDLANCRNDLAACQADVATLEASVGALENDLDACAADRDAAVACGNGVVDAGEDCDFGDLAGATCVSEGFPDGTLACGAGCVYDTSGCKLVKRVFVTSVLETGHLGGLSGGDGLCQHLANEADLGGTWRAWLSDSSTHARDRITDAEYRLVNGTLVATSLADLTDGSLANGINRTETGSTNIPPFAWTGTKADGTRAVVRCNDWTVGNTSREGVGGVPGDTGGSWTSTSFMLCDNEPDGGGGLYCFEL